MTLFTRRFQRIVLLCAAATVTLLHAEETEWRATFHKANITPKNPVFMAGYASRDRPFESVEADLFAKAMVLTDAEGHQVILITTGK
ncbi:MAG: hypothetical protein ACKVJU_16210 [Verrucomicrobiales bacterium]